MLLLAHTVILLCEATSLNEIDEESPSIRARDAVRFVSIQIPSYPSPWWLLPRCHRRSQQCRPWPWFPQPSLTALPSPAPTCLPSRQWWCPPSECLCQACTYHCQVRNHKSSWPSFRSYYYFSTFAFFLPLEVYKYYLPTAQGYSNVPTV